MAEQVFRFPRGFQLGPAAEVRIHSGAGAPGSPQDGLFWTSAPMWNDGGDRADLRDAGGQVVSTWGYGRCR